MTRLLWRNLLLTSLLLAFSALGLAATATEEQARLSSTGKVAQMSDGEVRQMLIDQLEQQSIARRPNPYDVLQSMPAPTNDFESRLTLLQQSLHRWPQQQQHFWDSLTDQRGWDGFSDLMIAFALMLLSGLAAEGLLGWKLRRMSADISCQVCQDLSTSVGYLLLQSALNLVRLGAFVLGALALPVLAYDPGTGLRPTLMALLIAVSIIRLVSILSRSLFAPYARGIRPFRMECEKAQDMHHWVIGFAITYVIVQNGLALVYHHGIEPILSAITVPLGGLLLNLIAIAFVWYHRHTITRLFADPEADQASSMRQTLRQNWPMLATIWLMLLWCIWSYHVFIGNYETAHSVEPVWWLTLGFILIDRLLHALLSRMCQFSWLQSHTFEQRSRSFIRIIQNGSRLILLGVTLFFLSETFGFSSMSMLEETLVQRSLSVAIDIMVILLLAYTCWQVIQSAIERRLPEPQENDAIANLEGEGGAEGASRAETLLPLVRSFTSVILVIVVALMALSVTGIEIGPLLAGAGVVGIAIGFGAQKLVQDILSGIFFLLDDAFRRGEYIEAAGLRGTVEQISLRSMRLRHHLGAVQTIPYSEIATVKNLSRDWVTMKLEFRLPYDTDIEQVRKIIKKVGQEMLNDAEMGPQILLPLKSQGVMRVEESALIFRMKFTCKPGEQWIIRREAYRRVKDALEANGIRFAHRSVHVLLPDNLPPAQTSDQEDATHLSIVGAAAAQAATHPDLLRSNRIDDDHGKNPYEDDGSA
ncbi:mechanosensitive ion channel family protein [Marinobacterium rhizophilum]|uniref:mechanosensitive ion channel family protein n=1 Tax=Marinobacterium rhizophilum TaxID=420402 RepID=UPI00035E5E4F|nr:mechanosensitive ion channel family protein [Marinobacterium rhizophilum]